MLNTLSPFSQSKIKIKNLDYLEMIQKIDLYCLKNFKYLFI